jgi:hypothetical protein
MWPTGSCQITRDAIAQHARTHAIRLGLEAETRRKRQPACCQIATGQDAGPFFIYLKTTLNHFLVMGIPRSVEWGFNCDEIDLFSVYKPQNPTLICTVSGMVCGCVTPQRPNLCMRDSYDHAVARFARTRLLPDGPIPVMNLTPPILSHDPTPGERTGGSVELLDAFGPENVFTPEIRTLVFRNAFVATGVCAAQELDFSTARTRWP